MEDEIHGLLLTGKSEGAFSRQSVVRINVHVIRVFYLLPPRPRVPTINSFSVSKKVGREQQQQSDHLSWPIASA